MSISPSQMAAFRADLGDIACRDDAKLLASKSKDYYWYSPILKEQLDGRQGQLVVLPKNEEEVITIAAAIARHRIPLTIRGGGTGNYGQCVPMEGGVILETTKLDRVIGISEGRVVCEAGTRLERLEHAVAESGQMLSMFPSTKRLATVGGFIAGGSGGIGSLRNGMLRDGTNVTYLRIITVEPEPRVIELHGRETLKALHALTPAINWVHTIALFDDYATGLRFAAKAQAYDLEAYLMTVVEGRFAPFYRKFADYFPSEKDAVFSMIAPDAMEDFKAQVAAMGGAVVLAKTLSELEAENLPPTWECGWNHTTLQALKVEPEDWSYLQVAYPRPFDPDLVMKQIERYGDEVLFHHEMARMASEVQIFALPLVRWTSKERMYEIIKEMETEDGCTIFDPHAVTIEDGGMKEVDSVLIDFKKEADPFGLMNPGKTKGWSPEMALQ